MYRTYKVSAGAISRGELREFNPETNSHGYDYVDTSFIQEPNIEAGTPPVNARPYGPNLAQRLAPPNFEVVFSGAQPVELRIGATALTDAVRYPVETLTECQQLAEAQIDVLRQANKLLERCTLNEAEKIDFADDITRVAFQMACAQNWNKTNFIDTVVSDAFQYFSNTMTGAAMRPMVEHFLQKFITSLETKDGVGPENIARAMKIGCVEVQPHLNAFDAYQLANFSAGLNERIENLWQQRNDALWQAWSTTDIAATVPAQFSAQFKTAFIHEMSETLNGYNWNGDMALVYNTAYHAAFIAGEKALQMDNMEVAEQYCKVQDACVAALDKIREDSEKEAPFEHREREIKLFDNTPKQKDSTHDDGQTQTTPDEDGQSQDANWPNFDDGPGGR